MFCKTFHQMEIFNWITVIVYMQETTVLGCWSCLEHTLQNEYLDLSQQLHTCGLEK